MIRGHGGRWWPSSDGPGSPIVLACTEGGDIDERLLVPEDGRWHLVRQLGDLKAQEEVAKLAKFLKLAHILGPDTDIGYRSTQTVQRYEQPFAPRWIDFDGRPYEELWIRRAAPEVESSDHDD